MIQANAMLRRPAPIALITVSVFALAMTTSCQWEGPKQPPAEVEDFATPEATFETARQAFVEEDFKEFATCFTSDGLDELAGGLRVLGGILYAVGCQEGADEQSAALAKAIKVTFDKYLPADPPDMNFDFDLPQAELRAQIRDSGRVFKDRNAFVVEFFEALSAHGNKQPDKKRLQDSHLDDLRLDRDRASATISYGFLDGKPTPVIFRRLDGQWKIDSMGRFGSSS